MKSTEIVYDKGVPTRVTVNGRTLVTRVVNGLGLVTSETDENGQTTVMTYDSGNRPTKVTPPIDDPTVVEYVDVRQTRTTRGPSEAIYLFDNLGRLVEGKTKVDSAYSHKTTRYDELSRVSFASEPFLDGEAEVGTTVKYDGLSRPIEVTTLDGKTTTAYGAESVTETDAAGKTTTLVSDAFGRLVSVTDQLGNLTTYGYDALNRQIAVTHPGGNVAPRSFSYNAGGMLLTETNPEAGTTSYEYDGLGRVISRKDAANRVLAYAYDSWDRITQLTGVDVSRSYTYDGGPFGKGRLTSVTDEAGVTTITNRDALGRPLELQRTTDGRTYLTRYAFDAHGNLSSLEYPHATNEAVRLALSYTYNSAGLPTSIVANGSQSIAGQITYNAALGPRSMQLGNGVTYSIAADPASRNRPTTISTAGVKKNNQPFDLSMAYRYDSRGLIDQITNNGRVDSYTYDPRQMLTGVTYTGEGSVDYAYDANGNMTSRSSTNPTWAANLNFTRSYTNNKISDPGFAYSPTGALVAMPGNQYEYDGLDQLRRADQRFRFLYDGNGLQAIKLDEQTGTKQYQFYGAGDLLLTRYAAASGAVPAATEDLIYFGNHILATSDSSFHWVVSDHRGTARLLVDAQGTVEGEFEDFPFGEAKTRTTFGLPSIYQFKQRDDDLGLYDFGARWYSEKLGRFLTVDPAWDVFPEDPKSWNRFGYVRSNPLRSVDGNGMWEWLDNLWRKLVQKLAPPKTVSEKEHQERQELLKEADYPHPDYNEGRVGGVGAGEKFADGAREAHARIGSALSEEGITQAGAVVGANLLERALGWLGRVWGRISKTSSARGVGKVDDAAKAVGDWLGDRARVITNKSGDKVFINEAGTRRVRFDLNNPHPHQNPHMHVEELVDGQWVKSGPINPTSVPQVP